MSTYGPAFEASKDLRRLTGQIKAIYDLMVRADNINQWLTLYEIENATGYSTASISAQLRHLRKAEFGGHAVMKRRQKTRAGTWEYRVTSR